MQGIKSGLLGLALSSFIGNDWAADVCARAQDITALQAAAVQQELMVAAFVCNDSGLYNSFVIAYQKDLQNSDQTLLDFFQRLNRVTGPPTTTRSRRNLRIPIRFAAPATRKPIAWPPCGCFAPP